MPWQARIHTAVNLQNYKIPETKMSLYSTHKQDRKMAFHLLCNIFNFLTVTFLSLLACLLSSVTCFTYLLDSSRILFIVWWWVSTNSCSRWAFQHSYSFLQRVKDGLAQNSINLGSVIKIKMYLIHKVKLHNTLNMGHPLDTDLL